MWQYFTSKFSHKNAYRVRQHRGLRSLKWSWWLTLGLLFTLFIQWALVLVSYLPIQQWWLQILAWLWPRLGLGSADQISLVEIPLLANIHIQIVKLQILELTTQRWQWFFSILASLGLILSSYFLSRERLPLIYIVRTIGIVWLLGIVLHYLFLDSSSLNIVSVLNELIKIGVTMLWFIPLLHALVLYIFPLPLIVKLGGTLVALLFVVISIPLQVASLAWLVQQAGQMIVLPLCMLATFLPHIVAQLGIYGYFMSLGKPNEI